MKTDRWQRIHKILRLALKQSLDQRAVYLEEVCAGDLSPRREVESLIASHQKAATFIEKPALDSAPVSLGDQNVSPTNTVRIILLLIAFVSQVAPVRDYRGHTLPREFVNYKNSSPLLGPHNIAETIEKRIINTYNQIPLRFEANCGQADPQIKFLATGTDYSISLFSTGATFTLLKPEKNARPRRMVIESNVQGMISTRDENSPEIILNPEDSDTPKLRMKFIGANQTPQIEPLQRLSGETNYLLGSDQKNWITDIPRYARVKYSDIYPGVDLVYYSNGRNLEYDFILMPGANPKVISMTFEDTQKVYIDASGDLILSTTAGELRHHKPSIYQEINGVKKEIAGHFSLKPDREIGIEVGVYDTSEQLVIDPIISYSTYLYIPVISEGFLDDSVNITVDSLGYVYVTGTTSSSGLITTPGAFQNGLAGQTDIFVAKLNETGSALVYLTYLGGDRNDYCTGLAIDHTGNVFISGYTQSDNFPTTPDAFQSELAGSQDAFIVKLNQMGSALVYATLLGGGSSDYAAGVAVDSSGHAYVTGGTASPQFPITPGAFQYDLVDEGGVFVTKLNNTGTGLVYSTVFGKYSGSSRIAIDSFGNAYITGHTLSVNFFPSTPGAYKSQGSIFGDVFVVKLNSTGTALVYSTFLHLVRFRGEYVTDTAIDPLGNIYVVGYTHNFYGDFPVTPGAFRTTSDGSQNVFLLKLNSAGSAIVYATLLGGSGDDYATSVTVDSLGQAFITGATRSFDFPTRYPIQLFNGGIFFEDAFIVKLNATGSDLLYSTYFGGRGSDYGNDLALDASGNVFLIGQTGSPDLPRSSNALQPFISGPFLHNFVTKIDPTKEPNEFGISSVSITGKQLFVFGKGFDNGSVIVIDGQEQETRPYKNEPAVLLSKKAGKKIGTGQPVLVQVRNTDGRLTESFKFTRPLQ